MSPVAVSRQTQTGFNDDHADLLQVPVERAAGLKKWKSLTRIFCPKKKSSPSLRQTPLAIDIDTANGVPYDIDDLADSDFTQSSFYSPELAAIVSSGGRSKRWALCLTPTPVDFAHDAEHFPDRGLRETGGRSTQPEEERARRPTLYLILAPDQDPSCSSEAIMLVGTREELRSKTGGGDVLERGL